MLIKNIDLIAKIIVILVSLFSVVYTFGVVWRVEKKLDISYKLLLVALLFFVAGEILDIFNFGNRLLFSILSSAARITFAFFFLFGILEMRSLIRKMDGEK
jgi:hypothetical protein